MSNQEFEKNYEIFKPELIRYFYKRGFTREFSEDMAQETFLRAFRSKFRKEASYKTWIFRIAKSVLAARHRYEKAAMRQAWERG